MTTPSPLRRGVPRFVLHGAALAVAATALACQPQLDLGGLGRAAPGIDRRPDGSAAVPASMPLPGAAPQSLAVAAFPVAPAGAPVVLRDAKDAAASDLALQPDSAASSSRQEVAPAPQWVQNTAPTTLWSSHLKDATAFTRVPSGSYLRVQGPEQDGRLPVYYVGDGLTRRPGGAWVDARAVKPIDPPAPGAVPQIDTFAARSLPEWVQAHRATTLWSGPDGRAVALTSLPQWSYLRVDGLERGGRLLIWYAGDYGSRQPGIGWVGQAAVGPAGAPGVWVENFRPTSLWSGPDDGAVVFTDLPQWTALKLLGGGPSGSSRLMVEYFGDGVGRQPGVAWVANADVGPITPPAPLPVPLKPGQQAAGSRAGAIQTRTFTSEADFVQTIGAAARRSQAQTGVPASVTVAQAILESDWGRSRLSRQANNLFGIKALSGPGPAGTVSFSTWEVSGGQDIVVQAPFRAYHSVDESVDDHGWFFVRNPRYADALAVAGDPAAFARAIQAAGYATDPGYADKLIRLMDRYDLYRFDR